MTLIDRLQAIIEPSRELDWEIHGAPAPPKPAYDWGNIPRYTASLDAAITLIPQGLMWAIEYDEFASDKVGPYFASVWSADRRTIEVDTHSPTNAALALCAAALAARYQI